MINLKRFNTMINDQDLNQTLTFKGWVDTVRDHGHLLFIHLRDRKGILQAVFDPQNTEAYNIARTLRHEDVVSLTGLLELRSADTVNPQIETGKYELTVTHIEILSKSDTPPFSVSEKDDEQTDHVDEDLRLAYRYLDIRRPSLQSRLIKRSEILQQIRSYFYKLDFVEVETPVLTKSTPEGARDYLVPSRVNPHHFYALPQSPQLFKQMLMVGGMERYFQIVKCFRDEDLRPNRQPEFTQLDIELSFVEESDVRGLIEPLLVSLFQAQGITLPTPFPQITYNDAISKYGSDKPDLRFGLELVDVTSIFQQTTYKIFQTILQSKGLIKGINLKGLAPQLSKNILQEELAKGIIPKLGAKGMTWMKVENGQLESNIVQFFSETEKRDLLNTMKAEDGDVLIFIADISHQLVHSVLGKFRLYIAERFQLIPATFSPCWVVDFPMFEIAEGHLSAVHHPFTQPQTPFPEHASDQDLIQLKARAYDVVINGEEIGGGSIRIHDWQQQEKLFQLLGMKEDAIKEQFGFFIQALKYGAPPHGGIALGIDRLVSMLLGTTSIRDVIAFPKNRMAYCPLTQAPSLVEEKQLKELHIALNSLFKE